jgi:hypothetical protein
VGYAAGGSVTTQRVSGPSGYSYAIQVAPQSGSTQVNYQQRIESLNCQDLTVGTNITISGLAYVDSTANGTFNVNLGFPSGVDNYASETFATAQTITLAAGTYTYFSKTFTLSTTGTNGLDVILGFISAAGRTFKITGVRLEVGSVATPFERRLYGQEVLLCQRYYCKTFSLGTAPGNNVTSTGALKGATRNGSANEPSANWKFPASMRTEPTVTLYNTGSGTAGQWSNDGTSTSSSNARSQWISTEGCAMDNTGNAFNYTSNIQASASAEL